jgi:UDP-MurNAc hydroxylase
MRIEWVNHASFVIRSGGIHLITDPWLDGTAFNHGWKLLSPTVFRYEDFADVTHIWFSHEHPDHFSPPNLKRIPEELRRRITVLFHQTKDKRVLKVCKAYGFAVQELTEGEVITLAGDVRLLCGRQGLIDSWIAVFADGKTLLNMNDCIFTKRDDLLSIKQKVGKVDVSLLQFSYANWVGNVEDHASHSRHARRKLNEMIVHLQLFQPSSFVPCASFVYFSHSENFFMNERANRIDAVYELVSRDIKVPTVVLYPGDTWEVGDPWDSSTSIGKYQADSERVLSSEPDTSPPVELSRMKESAAAFIRKGNHRNNGLLLKALPSAVIRLNDLGIDVELSYRDGLKKVTGKQPDIMTSSDSLNYCLQFDWGGDTLAVNGRYQTVAGGNARAFFRIFRVAAHNSAGNSFDLAFLGHQAMQKVGRAFVS